MTWMCERVMIVVEMNLENGAFTGKTHRGEIIYESW